MLFFFNFFKKYGILFLFLFLQWISFFLIFKQNVFHESYFNQLVLDFNKWYNGKITRVICYFNLKKENFHLMQENNRLRSMLYGNLKIDSIKIRKIEDSLKPYQQYEFISAQVFNNQLIYKDNFYYINRGKNYQIKTDMGVISDQGITGQIFKVFNNYAQVMSVLNSKIRVNARIKNRGYFGTLLWIADDPRLMHMYDIPKYVDLTIGDTLETANSMIFPEGILIGTIIKKNIEKKTGNWDLSIKLFQEMARLSRVNIIRKIITNKMNFKYETRKK